MDKAKDNIAQKVVSALLSVVLALGVCLPVASFASVAAPEAAWAAEDTNTFIDNWTGVTVDDIVDEYWDESQFIEGQSKTFDGDIKFEMGFELNRDLAGVVFDRHNSLNTINQRGPATVELVWNDGERDVIKFVNTVPYKSDEEFVNGDGSLASETVILYPSAEDPNKFEWDGDYSDFTSYVRITDCDGEVFTSDPLPVFGSGNPLFAKFLEYQGWEAPHDIAAAPVYIDIFRAGAGASVYTFASWLYFEDYAVVEDAADEPASAPASLKLVSPEEIQAGVSYSVFKIFDADVTGSYDIEGTDEEGNTTHTAPKAANIKFAAGITPELIGIIATGDDNKDAQTAAEFVGANMAHQPGVGLVSGSYGMELAKKLVAAGLEPIEVVADADDFVNLDGEGYYIVVRTDELTGEKSAASSPIYAALSGETTIKLKTNIPEVFKQIKEDDGAADWGKRADHSVNQNAEYRLSATVAENVDAYETYKLAFHDTFEAGKLVVNEDSIKVFVDGVQVIRPDAVVTLDNENGTLDVTLPNMKAIYVENGINEIGEAKWELLPISADTVVTVEYTAYQDTLTANTDGVQNDVYLEYSNNPIVDSTGTTPKDSVKDYSYSMRIVKTDNATGELLDDAEFSIQSDNGKWIGVDEEGKIVEYDEFDADTCTWVTKDGVIVIDGVDIATYTVTETKAPTSAYQRLDAPFTIQLTADDKNLDGEEWRIAANNGASMTTDTDLVVKIDKESVLADTDSAASIQVNVKNVKQIDLPSTGAAGLFGLIIIASIVAVFATRRKKDEADAAQIMTV